VIRATSAILAHNSQLAVLQCNTNYTGSHDNFRYSSLNVLKLYQHLYPDLIIGLSDHTPGHAAVLGAVALGARIIEKHFTDDNGRVGPDHSFSLDPKAWKEMVLRTRELEMAFGNNVKIVEENEKETVVVQRRCVRAAINLNPGDIVTRDKISVLRPAPATAIMPYEIDKIIGLKINKFVDAGRELTWELFK
jgi:N-acetylneuraminate synthase